MDKGLSIRETEDFVSLATEYVDIVKLGWGTSFVNLGLAVVCFNLAYASTRLPVMALFIVGYAGFLVQLTNQPTVRRAFYFGLATGFAFCTSNGNSPRCSNSYGYMFVVG